jgi:hypothetical protein
MHLGDPHNQNPLSQSPILMVLGAFGQAACWFRLILRRFSDDSWALRTHVTDEICCFL